MKASILSSLVMLGLSSAFGPAPLNAQNMEPIHFTIPFNFNVGSTAFRAGEYEVRKLSAWALSIQNSDGRASQIVLTQSGKPGTESGIANLLFHRYGDHYFLSRLSETGKGWELPPTAAEKELIAKRAEPPSLSVIASNK
jgi:hypothetical protein